MNAWKNVDIPGSGEIFFATHIFCEFDCLASRKEEVWVKTKKRRRNWPVLSGRLYKRGGKIYVVGHGWDQDYSDRFVWTGTERDFGKIWESDAEKEPLRFDFFGRSAEAA